MAGRVYLDTSAVAKLFVAEKESSDLREWLSSRLEPPTLVSSALLGVELIRLLGLVNPAMRDTANSFLAADVDIVEITPPVLGDAAGVPPPRLRTLDAIHLATALDLRDSLDVMLTYDKLLAEAARAAGLAVVSPGAAC
ncbi:MULTISPECIES: type II toxin-antitoxin system VapC family toxin [Protofrankia]|uniref:Ribonuclease VapC n=1 Tax=Protofrankia coriariae TaxID=1562887 RepID=A0ABR5F5W4_9ACTN|nr:MULTISPECIES: type II toxin-antitoxin system VapC family toxin [Protofrankia]KLL12128.1 twitching motility protein PilT [Protofrankia coriariae]ONH37015.1 VapC toxin family PIN domain ribonuclease [Protofrankia sp. BMG5.30]